MLDFYISYTAILTSISWHSLIPVIFYTHSQANILKPGEF